MLARFLLLVPSGWGLFDDLNENALIIHLMILIKWIMNAYICVWNGFISMFFDVFYKKCSKTSVFQSWDELEIYEIMSVAELLCFNVFQYVKCLICNVWKALSPVFMSSPFLSWLHITEPISLSHCLVHHSLSPFLYKWSFFQTYTHSSIVFFLLTQTNQQPLSQWYKRISCVIDSVF